MNTTYLRFHDLETDKMLGYVELCNKIDGQLGRKLKRSLPLRLGMAFLTGGTSLIFSGPRTVYQIAKKSLAQDAAKEFVEKERLRRKCNYVEWNTFPGSHLVIGGEPMQGHGEPVKCPLCKRIELRGFVASGSQEIFCCSHCGRTLAVKVNRNKLQTEEVIIPGLLIAPIPFTHPVEHIGNLAEHVGDLADSIGDVVATLIDTTLDIFC